MSLGLIKPGLFATALRHPKTGALIRPIGHVNGKAVWPVLGASPDDPDDPEYTGGDDDSDEEDSDEDDKDKSKPKAKTKAKSDDDEEDEDESPQSKASRQAKNYRLKLRATERQLAEVRAEIKALQDKDKPDDEVVSRDLSEAQTQVETLTEVNRIMSAQLAFFKSNTISWVDANDAFALAEREGLFDDLIDDDGTVDKRELQRGLKDLAKRKPHLVNKPKPVGRTDAETDDDEDEEEEERPRRSAPSSNRRRKGERGTTNRAALEKQFPVLRGR